MKCEQCDSATINGVFTHEHGCVNSAKRPKTLDELKTELYAAFEGQFMQPEIIKETFVEIETRDGDTEFMPMEFFDWFEVNGSLETLTIRRDVYGARLSAPGYLDCTEWCAFDTEHEAVEFLLETYGDHNYISFTENDEAEQLGL